MSTHPFPRGLGFGAEVIVTAEVMRLLAELTEEEGVYLFKQNLRSRGYQAGSKYGEGARFTGTSWPGAPVSLEWAPARAAAYPLEPMPRVGSAPQRLRRMLSEPRRGVVIGVTDRSEGSVIERVLRPPSRTIRVLEVALAVPSGSARVILVHPHDAQPVPRPRTSP